MKRIITVATRSGKRDVEVLKTFTAAGYEFAVHRSIDHADKFTCTEVSTGYAIGHSDCVAGNGNIIPRDLRGFTAYCAENIPKTTWLHSAVAAALAKGGNTP